MIRDWIEAALKGSGWTYDEIMAGVGRGEFFLFEDPEGCMVAEFITSPRHRVFHVFAAGGSMAAIERLLPVVEVFGKSAGCDIGGATGRKGWVRYLKRYGYEPAPVAVSKEL